jgi:hypothetical protein
MEKVISPTKGEMMPMTEEHFFRVIGLHDELIHEQRVEIGRLHMQVVKLQQKLDKFHKAKQHGST